MGHQRLRFSWAVAGLLFSVGASANVCDELKNIVGMSSNNFDNIRGRAKGVDTWDVTELLPGYRNCSIERKEGLGVILNCQSVLFGSKEDAQKNMVHNTDIALRCLGNEWSVLLSGFGHSSISNKSGDIITTLVFPAFALESKYLLTTTISHIRTKGE